jgi:cytochrome c peroxidase
MGIMEPDQTENPAEGRIAVTGKDADRFSFKVPTLRNVELTYPYFHDGAYWKLEDAVDVMARLQLGQKLEKQDIQNITAFLKTLTGDQPKFAVPQLPPSTADTPIPVPFED